MKPLPTWNDRRRQRPQAEQFGMLAAHQTDQTDQTITNLPEKEPANQEGRWLTRLALSVGGTPMAHLSGYMDKLSESKKRAAYATYYFLLRGCTLFWFSRRSDQTHTGSILLRYASLCFVIPPRETVSPTNTHSGNRNCEVSHGEAIGSFLIKTSLGKRYQFKAANAKLRDQWIASLLATGGVQPPPGWEPIQLAVEPPFRRYRSRSSPAKDNRVTLSPHRAVRHSCEMTLGGSPLRESATAESLSKSEGASSPC